MCREGGICREGRMEGGGLQEGRREGGRDMYGRREEGGREGETDRDL